MVPENIRRVPAEQAAAHLIELLDAVEAGDEIVLVREGHPAVPLGPAITKETALHAAIEAGHLDPRILDDPDGSIQAKLLADLAASARHDPENSATAALLAMREAEEDR
jgi:antitoxin (DNA-binding transcriptional repressor) of toxin-antitoxin stability system